MALVSRLFTSPSYSRQVILLVRARCSSLASRSLQPARSSKSNGGVNCSWRFFSSSSALLRNAGLKTAEKVKPKLKSEEVRRLIGLAKPEKYRLLGGIGLLFVSSAITMVIPFAIGKVIDIISANQESMVENLTNVSLILVGIFIFGAACNFGRTYLMSVAGERITQTMRRNVYAAIVKQDVKFFDKNQTGELVNRLSTDTTLVSKCVTANLADGIRSSALVVSAISMMFYTSPQIALVGLSIVPPVAVLTIVYGRFVKKITKKVQDALAQATQVTEERISNIRTVRAFGQEKREFERYNEQIDHVLTLGYKEAKARGTFFALTGFAGNAIIISGLYYGGLMVADSSLTVGQLSAFLLYAAYVGISMGGLSSSYSEMMKGLGASTRIWQLIDTRPDIPISGGPVIPAGQFEGSIRFRDLSFAYPTRFDVPIFNNLNLSIPAGSVTAIVGSSGSGKSTIAALLLRFYDPTSGQVLVDNHSIKDLDPQWLRANIGTVSQEPSLFSCSIRENILYGAIDPNSVSEEQVIQAAKEANAWSFIQKCPQGLDTVVGERGVLLSGGQRQRIAIARAIVKNPRILLLDEATSALDAESESLIQEALERVTKGRTVLTIAHRLSTIRKASQIAVLEHGQVVELGTYEALVSIPDGVFKKLVELQTIGLAAA
ncbi:ATP-binding cassette sub-family B member 10, mitochondrial-like [Daphnia pulicaria]|uniref:ATP-binding cassette sub-family B member 10, mitochondrial-like n=1 Tax=Daphnia pulicaria TaxID=35523 RepID=UPI001EEB6DFE|nr:ATP-binding cassette sub-family B member 10, mitochondrial-like [Daphnia pulicaria]